MELEFHSMKRKQLQALCKKHGIPANLTNLEMANRLSSLLKETEPSSSMNLAVNKIDSAVVRRETKKVRFSSVNETFIFVQSEAEATTIRKRPWRRKTSGSEAIPISSDSETSAHKKPVRKRRVSKKFNSSTSENVDAIEKPPPAVETTRWNLRRRGFAGEKGNGVAGGNLEASKQNVSLKQQGRIKRQLNCLLNDSPTMQNGDEESGRIDVVTGQSIKVVPEIIQRKKSKERTSNLARKEDVKVLVEPQDKGVLQRTSRRKSVGLHANDPEEPVMKAKELQNHLTPRRSSRCVSKRQSFVPQNSVSEAKAKKQRRSSMPPLAKYPHEPVMMENALQSQMSLRRSSRLAVKRQSLVPNADTEKENRMAELEVEEGTGKYDKGGWDVSDAFHVKSTTVDQEHHDKFYSQWTSDKVGGQDVTGTSNIEKDSSAISSDEERRELSTERRDVLNPSLCEVAAGTGFSQELVLEQFDGVVSDSAAIQEVFKETVLLPLKSCNDESSQETIPEVNHEQIQEGERQFEFETKIGSFDDQKEEIVSVYEQILESEMQIDIELVNKCSADMSPPQVLISTPLLNSGRKSGDPILRRDYSSFNMVNNDEYQEISPDSCAADNIIDEGPHKGSRVQCTFPEVQTIEDDEAFHIIPASGELNTERSNIIADNNGAKRDGVEDTVEMDVKDPIQDTAVSSIVSRNDAVYLEIQNNFGQDSSDRSPSSHVNDFLEGESVVFTEWETRLFSSGVPKKIEKEPSGSQQKHETKRSGHDTQMIADLIEMTDTAARGDIVVSKDLVVENEDPMADEVPNLEDSGIAICSVAYLYDKKPHKEEENVSLPENSTDIRSLSNANSEDDSTMVKEHISSKDSRMVECATASTDSVMNIDEAAQEKLKLSNHSGELKCREENVVMHRGVQECCRQDSKAVEIGSGEAANDAKRDGGEDTDEIEVDDLIQDTAVSSIVSGNDAVYLEIQNKIGLDSSDRFPSSHVNDFLEGKCEVFTEWEKRLFSPGIPKKLEKEPTGSRQKDETERSRYDTEMIDLNEMTDTVVFTDLEMRLLSAESTESKREDENAYPPEARGDFIVSKDLVVENEDPKADEVSNLEGSGNAICNEAFLYDKQPHNEEEHEYFPENSTEIRLLSIGNREDDSSMVKECTNCDNEDTCCKVDCATASSDSAMNIVIDEAAQEKLNLSNHSGELNTERSNVIADTIGGDDMDESHATRFEVTTSLVTGSELPLQIHEMISESEPMGVEIGETGTVQECCGQDSAYLVSNAAEICASEAPNGAKRDDGEDTDEMYVKDPIQDTAVSSIVSGNDAIYLEIQNNFGQDSSDRSSSSHVNDFLEGDSEVFTEWEMRLFSSGVPKKLEKEPTGSQQKHETERSRHDAQMIADLIEITDTEARGDLIVSKDMVVENEVLKADEVPNLKDSGIAICNVAFLYDKKPQKEEENVSFPENSTDIRILSNANREDDSTMVKERSDCDNEEGIYCKDAVMVECPTASTDSAMNIDEAAQLKLKLSNHSGELNTERSNIIADTIGGDNMDESAPTSLEVTTSLVKGSECLLQIHEMIPESYALGVERGVQECCGQDSAYLVSNAVEIGSGGAANDAKLDGDEMEVKDAIQDPAVSSFISGDDAEYLEIQNNFGLDSADRSPSIHVNDFLEGGSEVFTEREMRLFSSRVPKELEKEPTGSRQIPKKVEKEPTGSGQKDETERSRYATEMMDLIEMTDTVVFTDLEMRLLSTESTGSEREDENACPPEARGDLVVSKDLVVENEDPKADELSNLEGSGNAICNEAFLYDKQPHSEEENEYLPENSTEIRILSNGNLEDDSATVEEYTNCDNKDTCCKVECATASSDSAMNIDEDEAAQEKLKLSNHSGELNTEKSNIIADTIGGDDMDESAPTSLELTTSFVKVSECLLQIHEMIPESGPLGVESGVQECCHQDSAYLLSNAVETGSGEVANEAKLDGGEDTDEMEVKDPIQDTAVPSIFSGNYAVSLEIQNNFGLDSSDRSPSSHVNDFLEGESEVFTEWEKRLFSSGVPKKLEIEQTGSQQKDETESRHDTEMIELIEMADTVVFTDWEMRLLSAESTGSEREDENAYPLEARGNLVVSKDLMGENEDPKADEVSNLEGSGNAICNEAFLYDKQPHKQRILGSDNREDDSTMLKECTDCYNEDISCMDSRMVECATGSSDSAMNIDDRAAEEKLRLSNDMISSTVGRTEVRQEAIAVTPKKPMSILDMKENIVSSKGQQQLGSLTASKSVAKRQPLKDLQQKLI